MTPATDGELHDLVRRIVEQVPGVSLVRVDRASVPGAGGVLGAQRRMGISIRAGGWSPTLHERPRQWSASISDQPSGPEGPYVELTGAALGGRIRHALADQLKAQRDLAAAARKAGIAHPRALPDGPGRWTVGHLHVTVATLDLMVRRLGPERALREICDRVAGLHKRDVTDSETHLMEIDGDIAGVFGGVPAFQPMERIADDRVTLRGRILTIREAIPATLLEALPGRPVRAVVETGIASLDDATIAEAKTRGTGDNANVLTVDLPSIRVADHPVLGPALHAMETRR